MLPVLDFFPSAAASLDMTADFAPLLFGLVGLLGLSAAGIVLSAVLPWMRQKRRTTAALMSSSSDLASGAGAPALSR